MIDNTTISINNGTSSLTNNKKIDSLDHQPSTLSEFYSSTTKSNLIETSETDNSISYNISDDNSENNIKNLHKTYSLGDRKNIVLRIDKIKNKKIYLKIFKIIHADNYKYTINSNGIFFNVTNLPDNILCKIDHLLCKYEKVLFEKSKQSNLFSKSNNVIVNFN